MIRRIIRKISSVKRIKNINRSLGCKIGNKTGISDRTVFEGKNLVFDGCCLTDSHIGYLSYLGGNDNLYKTHIGKFCSLSDHIEIVLGKHPMSMISTHPSFYWGKDKVLTSYIGNDDIWTFEDSYPYADENKKYHLVIGNDVWIGKYVKLMNGIKVGDGAVIGTGAVVTKDVPPYAVVGGVPAKIIKYRFDEETIKWLLELKWWDKDEEWLNKYGPYFNDIKKLKKLIEEESV